MSSIKTRIIACFEEFAPLTHHDIADELGIDCKLASAHLCDLRRLGLLVVVRKIKLSGRGRPCNLWRFA